MYTNTHTYTHIFRIYIYIYIYIYCHSPTDYIVVLQLLSVARQVGRLKLRSKPAQLYVRLSIIPFSPQANHVSSGITRHYVVAVICLHFCLTGYQSAQFIRRALHYASGSRKFLRQSTQPPSGNARTHTHIHTHIYLGYIYICTYNCTYTYIFIINAIIVIITIIRKVNDKCF